MPGPAAATHDGFRIVTPGLPPGQQSAAYSLTLEAEGGQSPYRWSLLSNRLPQGLRLNPSGSVSGTPSAAGVYTFTLRATDSSESPISAAQVYQLKIVPPDSAGGGGGAAPSGASAEVEAPRGPALQLTSAQLPDGQVSEAYSAAITVTGGLQPYAWTIASGALPSGLTLDPAHGQIQGAAAATGTFSFVVEVSDSSSPGQVVRQAYSIVVAALGAGSQ
jgi:large repetitive protein